MKIPGKDQVAAKLRTETKFQETLVAWKEPILPGTLFLAPNLDIISRTGGLPLFPEFLDVDKTIRAEFLPFNIELLHQDIHYYYIPPIRPKGYEIKPEIASGDPPKLVDTAQKDDAVLPSDTQGDNSIASKEGDTATGKSVNNNAQDSGLPE